MRELMLGVIGLGLAGGWYVFSGQAPAGNIYNLSVADAQNRLAQANTLRGFGPFGDMDVSVSKPNANFVRWSARGGHAGYVCDASIEAVEATKVQVRASCAGGSAADGVATGLVSDMQQIKIAEFVDSILDGRPYDKEKVSVASTAAIAKNYPSMIAGALKMEREMRDMDQQFKAQDAKDAALRSATSNASTNYPTATAKKFGEPTAMGQPSAAAPSPSLGQPSATGSQPPPYGQGTAFGQPTSFGQPSQ